MEDTGRISCTLTPAARRVVFGNAADAAIDAEMEFISRVDLAHILMLERTGVIDCESACTLIKEIRRLRACNFEPLRGRPSPRGLYLLYEDYLVESLGPHAGGMLRTGRSRNDLSATVLKLRLRDHYIRLLRDSLRLQAVVMRRSRRYADVTMPVYTHYQAAVPVTYGHYLAGLACALGRDIAGLTAAAEGLAACPLGAGAAGGTSLPIQPELTASLLGFDKPVLHSIDAVASRDLVLRLLASAAIMGVTLSRVASDLLLWTTKEFGFLALPDSLVGSSSMMPQKRNPFLLEHVHGRCSAAIGAFASSVTAMHKTPFTNSIAVGTEAVAPVWSALRSASEAAVLTRLVIAGARPNRGAMLGSARTGFTTATELANRLTVEGGMSFREAHYAVGKLISGEIERGGDNLEKAAAGLQVPKRSLDPGDVAQASAYGGGPARASLFASLEASRSQWAAHAGVRKELEEKWRKAEVTLDELVRRASDSYQPDDSTAVGRGKGQKE